MGSDTTIPVPPAPLSRNGRLVVLAVAFLGWLCAGMHMSITQLTGRAASIDLLGRDGSLDVPHFMELSRKKEPSAEERAWLGPRASLVGRWFAWNQCAFLF